MNTLAPKMASAHSRPPTIGMAVTMRSTSPLVR